MEKVIYTNEFFAEIETEQKANRPNILDGQASDLAIGYHNGLTMAKAIAIRLATPAPAAAPQARWEFEEPCTFGAGYVRCSNCGWKTVHEDPFQWLSHPAHKFCGSCGAQMNLK